MTHRFLLVNKNENKEIWPLEKKSKTQGVTKGQQGAVAMATDRKKKPPALLGLVCVDEYNGADTHGRLTADDLLIDEMYCCVYIIMQ